LPENRGLSRDRPAEALDEMDLSGMVAAYGTGCVGAVTISGLPQREDHNLVVETIARALGRELGDSALG
jgi:hypothetical protein